MKFTTLIGSASALRLVQEPVQQDNTVPAGACSFALDDQIDALDAYACLLAAKWGKGNDDLEAGAM